MEAIVKPVTLTFFYDSFLVKINSFSCFVLVMTLFTSALVGCSTDGVDPVVINKPVAFVERPLTNVDGDIEGNDLTEPQFFNPGAVLYLKESASPVAPSADISSAAFSDPSFLNDDGQLLYDVKDLSLSYDGKKLLFSMRAPELENVDDEDQPKWNIWEYDTENSVLRRIIDTTLNVRAEDGHDISPSYLADGRILFTSTRQSRAKAILLDEGKTGFAALDEDRGVESFNIHVMDDDGQNIEQLTFNQSHDLNPILLEDGQVLFSRWDNAGQTRNNGFNLYKINPDGTGLNYVYGRHSHDSGDQGSQVQYAQPRELENGNVVVSLREMQTNNFASQPTEINITDFVESDKAIDGAGISGQESIVLGLNTSGEQSIKGTYGSLFPLYDGTNRYLVSWSVCRVTLADIDTATDGAQPGDPESCTDEKLASTEYSDAEFLYGLYVLDADNNTQKVVELPKQGFVVDEALLMTDRPEPVALVSASYTGEAQTFADEGFGVIHIRSVYDLDGQDSSGVGLAALANPTQAEFAERPQRFVRIEKAVSIPDDNVYDFDFKAFGLNRAQSMREILGYAPIEPDGSVKVAVPANVAFAISVLDVNGQRTSERHQNWLQLAPGETVECIGCHTAASEEPHGRLDAQPDALNAGAATTGLPFLNTDPALFADMGETMAQTYARINGTRTLTPDIIYDDVWSDPAGSVEPELNYLYSALESNTPMSPACADSWSANIWTNLCRVVINYESHIHPIWSVDRADRTCTTCHNDEDSLGEVKVPDADLDLSNGPSTDDPFYYKSYRELLVDDFQLELVVENGVSKLIDFQFDTGEIEMIPALDENEDEIVDADGNQVLTPRLIPDIDENGDAVVDGNGDAVLVTVPITRRIGVPATMDNRGALRSSDFMDKFFAGGTHEGDLSSVELKLIAEWLDIGAQYYNNPFQAPPD
jgi:hypothetical protein